MRAPSLVMLLLWGATAAPAAADDGRYVSLHEGLNRAIYQPYRLGAANDGRGHAVEVMTSLEDKRVANDYAKQVESMADPAEVAARLSSLALLGAVGAPAVENAGVMLFSNADQLPTVAGLNVVYDSVNDERAAVIDGWVNFDGHVHTGRSHDGGDSYEAVLAAAAARGLGAVAITDHNQFDFARIAETARRMKADGRLPRDFIVVPGEEISSADGHILAYFISRRIEPGMSAGETIRAIHEQGGIAVAPHPSGSGGVGMSYAKALPFDGVEVMSAANVLPMGLLRDKAAADGEIKGKFVMASSDAHAAKGVGVMFTRVAVSDNTEAGLRSGFMAGRTRPVIENRSYNAYYRAIGSPAMRAVYWPLLNYVRTKGDLLNLVARLLYLDRVSLMTTWEHVVFRMADGVFLPSEALRLSRGSSDLQSPLQIRSAAVTKGPMRVAYEQYDLLGYSRTTPMWKLEAKVDF